MLREGTNGVKFARRRGLGSLQFVRLRLYSPAESPSEKNNMTWIAKPYRSLSWRVVLTVSLVVVAVAVIWLSERAHAQQTGQQQNQRPRRVNGTDQNTDPKKSGSSS